MFSLVNGSQHVQPCNTFKMAIPSRFLHPPIIPPHWHQIYYKWMFDYAQFSSRNPFTSKQQVLWVKFSISYNSFFVSNWDSNLKLNYTHNSSYSYRHANNGVPTDNFRNTTHTSASKIGLLLLGKGKPTLARNI
jgi:hypothetical protein